MKAYLYRRLWQSLLVLAGLIVVVFFVISVMGDPAALMTSVDATPEELQALRERLGLNEPLHVRFGLFLEGVLRLDFGDSLWQNQPALGLVVERLPATLYLAACAMGLALLIAVPLGVLAGSRPGTALDRSVQVGSLGAAALPDFWLALVLILVVAVWWGLVPVAGAAGLALVILPAITLAVRPAGRIVQLVRSSVLEESERPYVDTARSKGLSRGYIARIHVLRNALPPTVMVAADDLAGIVTGAVVVESIFGWPGVGYLAYQGINHRDMPIVVAAVFVVALCVILLNFLADLILVALDPRVRLGR